MSRKLTERDIVAIAYRRKQLARFERLLKDDGYFVAERARLQCRGDEAVWQQFFEENPWIFGYGLSFVYLSGLDDKKLEQVVHGTPYSNVASGWTLCFAARASYRVSAFWRSRRTRRSCCPRTAIVPDAGARRGSFRGRWLTVHATVSLATQSVRRLVGVDDDGNPTGEEAYAYMPKSSLVVGSFRNL